MKKLIVQITAAAITSFLTVNAFAQNSVNGCQTASGFVPFSNFRQMAIHFLPCKPVNDLTA